MANGIYTLAAVYIGSTLLMQEQQVSVTRDTKSNPVSTVQGGYQGESPGAPMMELAVDNAVPAADFEFDPGLLMQPLTPATFVLRAAGRSLTTQGFIYSDTFTHGTNQEAKISFRARASFAPWV